MRRFRNVAVAAIAMALMFSQWAVAQALNAIPADTLFFIRVNNIQQTSQKFANYTTELGIAQFQPKLQDPLGAFKQDMGVHKGLREDGDAIVAFLDPEVTGLGLDDSTIVLLPVTDYEAFIGNFENAKTEDGITEFQSPNSHLPTYAARWGDYAALSPSREMVIRQPETHLAIEGLAARQLQDQDAVFYANFEKIAAVALPKLRENRANILADVQRELQTTPEQQRLAPVVAAAVERGLDIAERFLEDARSATFGVTIGERGLNTTLTAEFKPDTYGARTIAQLKGSKDSLVSGLPQNEYLMYGGSAMDPKVATQLFEDLLNPVIQALGQVEGADAATANRFIEAMKTYYGTSTSQSWGMLAPNAALGEESLVQTVVVVRGDASKLLAAQKDMFQLQTELMQAFSGTTGQQVTINYTEKAKTVGDVELDRFTSEVNIDPNSPEAAQAAQAMQMIYGPGGLGGFTGIVDGKLLTATGVPEERLQEVIDAASSDENFIAGKAPVEAVAAELPAEQVIVVYIPIDQWVRTAAVYAAQFGMPLQVQLPPDLSPVGVSVATEGEALRIDSHIPTDLVQSLVAAGMQMMMGQIGPGGPGGPGGL